MESWLGRGSSAGTSTEQQAGCRPASEPEPEPGSGSLPQQWGPVGAVPGPPNSGAPKMLLSPVMSGPLGLLWLQVLRLSNPHPRSSLHPHSSRPTRRHCWSYLPPPQQWSQPLLLAAHPGWAGEAASGVPERPAWAGPWRLSPRHPSMWLFPSGDLDFFMGQAPRKSLIREVEGRWRFSTCQVIS